MRKVKVGIIGCGNISSIYCQADQKFDWLEIYACADLDYARAKARAEEFSIPKAYTVEQILADEEIEIIINLTIPQAHAAVSIQALEAGKHVYVEKPLAITLEDGKRILEISKKRNLLVGGAPDTFLGGGIQTCRKLIDDGIIGKVVAATGFMMSSGHESWHPDPAFYYQYGGGPMYDMGPYYITAFVNLIGPIRRVTGSTSITYEERTITSKPKFGEKIKVEVPTHITGLLDFENGAIASLITSFDVMASTLPNLEIYGSKGTIAVPDPNTFSGPVRLKRQGATEWEEIPLTHGYTGNSRGIGVADMAQAIIKGEKHKASGELTLHVLEVMHGIHEASTKGIHYNLTTTCQQPKALASDF